MIQDINYHVGGTAEQRTIDDVEVTTDDLVVTLFPHPTRPGVLSITVTLAEDTEGDIHQIVEITVGDTERPLRTRS